MSKSMIKTTLREIRQSLGRYLAIWAIVLLGVGFFAGLKITKPSMVATENQYLKEQNFFDFRLLSTIGFTDGQVSELAKTDGVAKAEGSVSIDALCEIAGSGESVYKIHQLPKQINKPVLESGRMPASAGECVMDSKIAGESLIGETITITENNSEDTLEMFKNRTYTIVGTVRSPYYMNFERGTTSIGEGRVTGFFYVPAESFDCDYLTEIYLTLTEKYDVYTDEYNDYIDAMEPVMKEKAKTLSQNRYDDLVADAQAKLDDAQNDLDEKMAEAEKELGDALKEIEDGEEEIASHEQEIADGKEDIELARNTLNSSEKDLTEQETQLLAMEAMLPPEQYQTNLVQIQVGKAQIEAARKELDEKEQELLDAEEELVQAKEDLEQGSADYEEAKEEFETETADAQLKIDDARAELDDIEKPKSYALTRNTNIGYACFESDSNIVAAIADVFPAFFFLVAALICMTTMNRMVEEQRTQIGVLKALGYSNPAIMGKFMFYAGSAALFGAVVGFIGGTWLFPAVIWQAYGIMYNIGEITYLFDGLLAAVSIVAALLCSVGTAYLSCRYELYSAPANLIRPKAPKSGKRILLERISFIWSRMKFLHKVSVRNLFRYKKRFFMMILGIGGCSALLVTGLGLRDSIMGIVDQQYDKIQIYDMEISFSEALSPDDRTLFSEETAGFLKETAFRYEESVDITFNGMTKSLYLEIPENVDKIRTFVDLHTTAGEPIPYPQEGEAVISAKIAKNLGIKAGDSVTLLDNDMRQLTVTVTDICENFVYNYIYINKETYKNQLGTEPEYKSAYAFVRDDTDIHKSAAAISDRKHVLSVSVISDLRERISTMMESMNYIVALIILCAGFLAFIVLYNLTNINITERIREIATIKVLGFYAKETADYVFRENLLLTGIGAVIGLLLGKWLHWFVMHNINIDMISFKTYIAPISYVWSILLTFVFAMLVNGLMFFKLEKINMAESLKSVE